MKYASALSVSAMVSALLTSCAQGGSDTSNPEGAVVVADAPSAGGADDRAADIQAWAAQVAVAKDRLDVGWTPWIRLNCNVYTQDQWLNWLQAGCGDLWKPLMISAARSAETLVDAQTEFDTPPDSVSLPYRAVITPAFTIALGVEKLDQTCRNESALECYALLWPLTDAASDLHDGLVSWEAYT